MFWDVISNGNAAYNPCSGTSQHFLNRDIWLDFSASQREDLRGIRGQAPPENLEFRASEICTAENASNFVNHW